MPKEFRISLLVIVLANLFTITAWEYFVVNGFLPYVMNRCKLRMALEDDNKNTSEADIDLERSGSSRNVL